MDGASLLSSRWLSLGVELVKSEVVEGEDRWSWLLYGDTLVGFDVGCCDARLGLESCVTVPSRGSQEEIIFPTDREEGLRRGAPRGAAEESRFTGPGWG